MWSIIFFALVIINTWMLAARSAVAPWRHNSQQKNLSTAKTKKVTLHPLGGVSKVFLHPPTPNPELTLGAKKVVPGSSLPARIIPTCFPQTSWLLRAAVSGIFGLWFFGFGYFWFRTVTENPKIKPKPWGRGVRRVLLLKKFTAIAFSETSVTSLDPNEAYRSAPISVQTPSIPVSCAPWKVQCSEKENAL